MQKKGLIMESILQYRDKGYDVEILVKKHDIGTYYTADIKYPCGELAWGKELIPTKRKAALWAVNKVNFLSNANHKGCADEYCISNVQFKNEGINE